MTKLEFLLKVPDIIEHPAHGYAELEIICDTKTEKGAQYRHKNKTTSGGNLAKTWDELYKKMLPCLINWGYKAPD